MSGRSEKPILPCKPGGYSGSGWEENQLLSVINLRHLLGAMQGSFGSDFTCFKSSKITQYHRYCCSHFMDEEIEEEVG